MSPPRQKQRAQRAGLLGQISTASLQAKMFLSLLCNKVQNMKCGELRVWLLSYILQLMTPRHDGD